MFMNLNGDFELMDLQRMGGGLWFGKKERKK